MVSSSPQDLLFPRLRFSLDLIQFFCSWVSSALWNFSRCLHHSKLSVVRKTWIINLAYSMATSTGYFAASLVRCLPISA